MDVIVLCVNSGSSSLKLALFEGEARVASCTVEGVGRPKGRLWLRGPGSAVLRDASTPAEDHAAAVQLALAALERHGFPAADAAGHRFVHGGPRLDAPRKLDATVLEMLRAATPFAPLHLPAALLGVAAVEARRPGLPQVACFDTYFHRDLPEVTRRLPLPRELHDRGVRRYGFHGLSYESIVSAVGARTLGRAVLAHLGNGASMAAVREGRCIDTTMGMTPAGGFMMSTRTGDLDPGVIVHLLSQHGYDARRLEELVDRRSGLLGVSGRSPDMKELLAARASDPAAALAVEMFCYQARKTVAGLAAALGGLDTLVFAGGIGENAAEVREGICAGLEWLGVRLDGAANANAGPVISRPDSACAVRIVPANEELIIARHTARVLAS